MSFYALPGPLHATVEDQRKPRPLFTPSTWENTDKCNSFVQAMAKRGKKASTDSALSALGSSSSGRIPKQQRVILDFSKMELENAHSSYGIFYQPDCGKVAEVDLFNYHEQRLKIHVNEALVDFLKLVRPCSPCASSLRGQSASGVLLRRTRRSRLHRRTQQHVSPLPSSRLTEADLDPYERALEIELAISFVGRSYVAKRSLQKIMQLGYDLQEELDLQEQCYHRRSLSHKSSDGMDESALSLLMSSCSQSFGDSSLNSSISSVDGDESLPLFGGFVIPDVPRMSVDSLGSFCNGGFKQMNEMRQVFQLALEEWFQQVIRCVPGDSPTLANFLWEPLSAKSLDSLHTDFTKLGPIQEY